MIIGLEPVIICRKKLDETQGNPWICECPFCREAKKKSDVGDGDKKEEEDHAHPN
jgi:hypothetical protein